MTNVSKFSIGSAPRRRRRMSRSRTVERMSSRSSRRTAAVRCEASTRSITPAARAARASSLSSAIPSMVFSQRDVINDAGKRTAYDGPPPRMTVPARDWQYGRLFSVLSREYNIQRRTLEITIPNPRSTSRSSCSTSADGDIALRNRPGRQPALLRRRLETAGRGRVVPRPFRLPCRRLRRLPLRRRELLGLYRRQRPLGYPGRRKRLPVWLEQSPLVHLRLVTRRVGLARLSRPDHQRQQHVRTAAHHDVRRTCAASSPAHLAQQ